MQELIFKLKWFFWHRLQLTPVTKRIKWLPKVAKLSLIVDLSVGWVEWGPDNNRSRHKWPGEVNAQNVIWILSGNIWSTCDDNNICNIYLQHLMASSSTWDASNTCCNWWNHKFGDLVPRGTCLVQHQPLIPVVIGITNDAQIAIAIEELTV